MNTEKFQKELSWIQIVATGSVAMGAVVVTLGLTMMSVFSGIPIPQENRTHLDIFLQIILYIGIIIIFLGLVVPYFRIKRLKLDGVIDKQSKSNMNEQTILFDEMYDGKDLELIEKGYDAFSVRKLCLEGKPLRSDYSVLNYVKENNMILITEDPENHHACQENNFQCVKLGQNPSIEVIIKELELLKNNNP